MTGGLSERERLLLNAVCAALPILREDRDAWIRDSTLKAPDGSPDLATIEEDAKPYVVECINAITVCEDALRKVGVR